jgi:uncharacterized membrane protein
MVRAIISPLCLVLTLTTISGCMDAQGIEASLDRLLAALSEAPDQPGALRRITYTGGLANTFGYYYMLRFELDQDQYITLAGQVPEARYWSVAIYDLAGRPIDALLDEDIILPGMEDFELAIAAQPVGDLPTLLYQPTAFRRSGWIFMRVVLPEGEYSAPVVLYHRVE